MKKEKQIQIIENVFKQLEKQKNKEDADGITYQIDVSRYTSKVRLEKEKELIFKNCPIVTGAVGNKRHSSIIFPKRALQKMKELPQSEWQLRKGANILLHIFPNTIILIEPDHLMVVTFCPIDEKTTQIKSFMLLPAEPTTSKEAEYWDLNANIFWNAINEDNEMAVLQQQSFNGFSDTTMTVGSYEKLLVQFENLVDEAIGA